MLVNEIQHVLKAGLIVAERNLTFFKTSVCNSGDTASTNFATPNKYIIT